MKVLSGFFIQVYYILYGHFIKLYCSQNSKILILSGSHGSQDGSSGLTDKGSKNVDEGYGFYLEDCNRLGIKPGPKKRSQRLPLKDWAGIPDITEPADKVENFVQDTILQNMDIRVCNICYYHGHSQKLIEDIQIVKISFLKAFKGGGQKKKVLILLQPM